MFGQSFPSVFFRFFKIKTFFEKKTDKREKQNLGGIEGEVNKLKD